MQIQEVGQVLVVSLGTDLAEILEKNPLNGRQLLGMQIVYDLTLIVDFDSAAINSLFNQIWEATLVSGIVAVCSSRNFWRLLIDCVGLDGYSLFSQTVEEAVARLSGITAFHGVDLD